MSITTTFQSYRWIFPKIEQTLKPPVGKQKPFIQNRVIILLWLSQAQCPKRLSLQWKQKSFLSIGRNMRFIISRKRPKKKTMHLGPGYVPTPRPVPHSPVRHADSIGLGHERKKGQVGCLKDGLLVVLLDNLQ